MQLEYPTCVDKYKLFAQFLLEGVVFSKLLKYKCHLVSLPATMTKPWAKLQPRTQTMLQALAASHIEKKQDLMIKWEQDKNFLLSQYCEWVPSDMQGEVAMMWPPTD
jgi:ATP-dependent RNA helicase DHX37/DHR1